MSAPSRGGFRATAGWLGGSTAELRWWAIGTLMGLLWCAALMIAWRRLVGAVNVPLSAFWLLAAGSAVSLAGAVVQAAGIRADAFGFVASRRRWIVSSLAVVAVLTIGVGLSLPGTNTWGLFGFWVLLLGGQFWPWRRAVSWRRSARAEDGLGTRLGEGSDRGATEVERRPTARVSELPTDMPPESDVVQEYVRRQAADGSEECSGWLRAPLTVGQRTVTVHLAFCPQFVGSPDLAVERVDGPAILRLHKTVFPFGARIDLKLAAATRESHDMVLRFAARWTPAATEATASTP